MALLRSLGSQQVRKCIQQKLCQPTIASSRRTKLTLVRRISQPTDGVTAAIQRKAEGARVKDVTWSANQRPRSQIISGPRFEQTNLDAQPHPLPAIELIKKQPVRMVSSRIAVCDGGLYFYPPLSTERDLFFFQIRLFSLPFEKGCNCVLINISSLEFLTGGGALGHPKIFINLDKPGPKPCGYCGLRFERSHDGHH
ncbi:hypothetical protein Pst134EB_008670 [Puccinia striiformis f. sp. tritici]|nr:hypothetical protein Pst134EB_008670 [Puccinia striiformis f. sp. tritici]